MAMNPEVKAEWVKALRSGEYKQGKNALRNDKDEHCCLGVLCELAVKAGAIPPAVLDGDRYKYAGREATFLPSSVEQWAGIVDQVYRDMDAISDLIEYNDGGKDFAYIADVIEARL